MSFTYKRYAYTPPVPYASIAQHDGSDRVAVKWIDDSDHVPNFFYGGRIVCSVTGITNLRRRREFLVLDCDYMWRDLPLKSHGYDPTRLQLRVVGTLKDDLTTSDLLYVPCEKHSTVISEALVNWHDMLICKDAGKFMLHANYIYPIGDSSLKPRVTFGFKVYDQNWMSQELWVATSLDRGSALPPRNEKVSEGERTPIGIEFRACPVTIEIGRTFTLRSESARETIKICSDVITDKQDSRQMFDILWLIVSEYTYGIVEYKACELFSVKHSFDKHSFDKKFIGFQRGFAYEQYQKHVEREHERSRREQEERDDADARRLAKLERRRARRHQQQLHVRFVGDVAVDAAISAAAERLSCRNDKVYDSVAELENEVNT